MRNPVEDAIRTADRYGFHQISKVDSNGATSARLGGGEGELEIKSPPYSHELYLTYTGNPDIDIVLDDAIEEFRENRDIEVETLEECQDTLRIELTYDDTVDDLLSGGFEKQHKGLNHVLDTLSDIAGAEQQQFSS